MSILSRNPKLNTIEDNRWELFQTDARRRRVIAITVTSIAIGLSYFFQTVWIFLAGEAGLWLALKYWRTLKK